MILRIYTGVVVSGREADLAEYLRSRAIPAALTVPGLISFQPAVRDRAGRRELTIVSTWADFEALTALGRRLDTPLAIADASDMLEDGAADHFELVSGGARGLPFSATRLTVTRGRLRSDMGASFFAQARREAEPLLDDAALVALHLGRRLVDGIEEVVAVTLWAASADLPAVESPGGISLLRHDGLFFADGELGEEEYSALTVTEPTAHAPALLLADDERRYLHATPAASRLTGISMARLLAMRVEDLASPALKDDVPALWRGFLDLGAFQGDFILRHMNGSEVPVVFSARARTPWPGCHASVLAPAAAPALDFDGALLAAGFISRYSAEI